MTRPVTWADAPDPGTIGALQRHGMPQSPTTDAAGKVMSQRLQQESDQAEQLAKRGNAEAAARLFQSILDQDPGHAPALHFFAMRAFANGDPKGALEMMDRCLAGRPVRALFVANKAKLLHAYHGSDEEILGLLQQATRLDPDFLPAWFDAGALLGKMGRPREANEHYRNALGKIPPGIQLPAPLLAMAEQANRSILAETASLEELLQERLAPVREMHGRGSDRFDECLDILMGRKRPQPSKPGFMHFPKLAPLTFYPREMFPWASELEASTATIREELLAVLATRDARFIPYVQKDERESGPGSTWNKLNNNQDWGVYFLFNEGDSVPGHCEACPKTTAILERLPLVRIPRRGPTAFFSRLMPAAHIPPHHGATNTRLIAHLPLIVPPGCGFRVGNDIRPWREGELIIFDDTIEHEAWNKGDGVRIVLIFDIWNPFLSEQECEMVAAVTSAMAEFYPGKLHNTDF